MTLRALELFCGIGGFAAAAMNMDVRVVGALDQDRDALEVCRAMPDRKKWRPVRNSLPVIAVREVLRAIPAFAPQL